MLAVKDFLSGDCVEITVSRHSGLVALQRDAKKHIMVIILNHYLKVLKINNILLIIAGIFAACIRNLILNRNSERIKNRRYSLRSKIPRSLLRGASIPGFEYQGKWIEQILSIFSELCHNLSGLRTYSLFSPKAQALYISTFQALQEFCKMANIGCQGRYTGTSKFDKRITNNGNNRIHVCLQLNASFSMSNGLNQARLKPGWRSITVTITLSDCTAVSSLICSML